MNADRLFALYDRVADAPDAVDRLRRFVLDLAVRGGLVEQDPADEPALELLKRIAAKKARMVKAGEIKAKKPLQKNSRDRASLSLPNSWSSVRLAEVAVCLDYMRKPINAAERAKRIAGKSEYELFPYFGATQQQGWIDDYLFDEELVLLGEDGVPFSDPFRSKAYLITGKAWVNNHAHVFKGILVSNLYLVHVLNVFDYTGRVVGATRTKLNQTRALGIPIPLPPFDEQRRIVAKVDELMALCDQLEDGRTAREDTRDRLTRASHARLAAPDTDALTLRTHARFSVDALPALTARADQVKQLRQTILRLAVRGNLVEQDPADEPASELLKRISVERKRLLRAKRIKAVRVGPIALGETPFRVPSNWQWTRLGQVIIAGPRNGLSPRSSAREDAPRAVTLTATTSGVFDGSHFKRVDADIGPDSEYWLQPNDLLFQRGNTPEYVGMAAIYDGPPGEFLFPDLMIRVRLSPEVSLRFVHLFCVSPVARIYFSENAVGAQKTMPKINQAILRALPIPLPPLSEQHCIVAKVDELIALCDRMETGLSTVDATRGCLLESLLHDALGSGPRGGAIARRFEA